MPSIRHWPFRPEIARRLACLLALAACACGLAAQNDLTPQYTWKPVRIGGGGWVVGMVLHPADATVRYARTDVGNAYRWDVPTGAWIPMRVSNTDGTGILSASATAAPSGYGVDSIAIDPENTRVVYMVFPTSESTDIAASTNLVEIYKSVDGGVHFAAGNMTAAAIMGNPNGPHRYLGERLIVDPMNPQVLYYGSDSQGVFRSKDGGVSWEQVASGLPTNVEFVNFQFDPGANNITVNGVTVSGTVYAVSVQNGSDAGGDVYMSVDGGQTWTDISTGVIDSASGQALSHQAFSSSTFIRTLFVPENSATNGGHRAFWRYALGGWTRISLEAGGVNLIDQPVVSVATDTANVLRIYALGADTGLARSDDGGATWVNLGPARYSNTLGWLPQTVGMANGEYHSNGGLKIDAAGNLWTPTGQEGPLMMPAAVARAATSAAPPAWTIVTTGIEEMVSEDIAVAPASGDTIVATAMDTTGFVIPNPDNFSAAQIPLQQEIIAQGTSVAYAPDVPSYIAVTSSNVYTNGTNYSGYSTDGGATWTRFGPALQVACGSGLCDIQAGIVAVSVRGSRGLGQDHIVLYPPNGLAPEYSQDGGKTWHVTKSFPLNADGMTIDPTSYNSFLFPELHQHLLRADPFVADRFYLRFTHAPALLYVSTDGGQTWQGQANANLPDYAWGGQLVVNEKLKNELWYADGFQGSLEHGLFHSTNGGQSFTQSAGISHALTVAVGAGSGQAGDAAYSVYFYGLMSGSAAWGIFRSTDGGASWDRVSYYPMGIYDVPNTMAASQDTFGKVYLGFGGNSFVYGQILGTAPALPGAPSALGVTAVSGTEIDLAWGSAGGVLTGYNVYRGTSSGAELATPIAAGVTGMTYSDKTVNTGITYFYKVAAVNAVGVGPSSNETQATASAPGIVLAVAAGSSTSATVNAGQTATFKLMLTSTNYAGIVTFTCSGAPAADNCVAPAAVTVNAGMPSAPISVTVQTTTAAARGRGPRDSRSGGEWWLAVLVLVPLGFRRRRAWLGGRRGMGRGWACLVLSLSLLGTLGSAAGCGSGGGNAAPAPVVSTLTVTASGPGVATATIQLQLTVD